MANGIEEFHIASAEETVRFIRMFDRAFDCLNVRSLCAVKPDLRGYRDASDQRLQVYA